MPQSVYIHIPFCKSKCYYCSFISFPRIEEKEKYLNALEKEIHANYEKENLNTLYFGGGTPSLLNIQDFEKLISYFNITEKTEIATELNPDDVNKNYASQLYNTKINRISLGCQTFNDEILKQINRRHNSKQVKDAVKNLQNAGFNNISLDFIYGLPNQTENMFYDDLKKAIDLGIKHISLYGLSIEKGCYFYSHKPLNLADDEKQADMYLGAVKLLTQSGFEHYEISNFALKGYYSQHNLNYWNNNEYYGFGVAAHGYKNNIRYGNKENIENYIHNPLEHLQTHTQTLQEKLEEEIFLGFRKMKEGINILDINKKYSIDFEKQYREILQKYLSLNLIKKIPQGYILTPKGALVSNTILADFLK